MQLYLAIGVPVLINAGAVALAAGLIVSYMNTRFDAINKRFDDMRDLWRAELCRRGHIRRALKHLEEK